MATSRLLLDEVRKRLSNTSAYTNADLLNCSATLSSLISQNLTTFNLTPDILTTIVNEITICQQKKQVIPDLAETIANLQKDKHFISPTEAQVAASNQNYEDIVLYEHTLLTNSRGSVYVDAQGNYALAPIPNTRNIAPPKSQDGYIGDLTPNDIELSLTLLEDELQKERTSLGIDHALNTVSDDGKMGVYGTTVKDLISIGAVSQSALDTWSAIAEGDFADYALEAVKQGLISIEVYDKIPTTLRSALHWYVLSHAEHWLEKQLGPKNFLTLQKIQRLYAYRALLSQWKTAYQYFINNLIDSKAEIAGHLIAQRIFGKNLSQLFGIGAEFSTIIGRSARDIHARVVKGIESGIKVPLKEELPNGTSGISASAIDAAATKIPAPTNPIRTSPKTDIRDQKENSLRKVPSSAGFNDPKNIYPRENNMGRPSTNPLATGEKIQDTIVGKKDSKRVTDVPIARNAAPNTWSQPKSPYNGKYPYNHVQETESGHVVEYDDTPQNERMHWYHRSGTFTEVDANGTHVRKIVGDGYEIWDRDGYIYIGGKANITIEGNCNILVKNNVNLEVHGSLKADIHNDVDFNVAGHFNVTSGGNINLKSAQHLYAEGHMVDVHSDSTMTLSGRTAASLTSMESSASLLSGGGSVVINGVILELMPSGGSAATLYAQPFEALQGTAGTPVNKYTPTEPKLLPLTLEQRIDNWASALATLSENADANKDEIKMLKAKGLAEGLVTQEDLEKPLTEGQTDTSKKPTALPAKVASCSVIYGQSNFSPAYRLSKNITLGNLKGTENLQAQHGLSIQDIVCNLTQLAVNVIEPVFDLLGKNNVIISSTFRTPGQMTGAFKSASGISFHEQGLAVDFCFNKTFTEYYDIAVSLKKNVQFDKLLLEYRVGNIKGVNSYKPWIHMQWQQQGLNLATGSGGKPRLEYYTFKNDVNYSASLVNLLPNSNLTY